MKDEIYQLTRIALALGQVKRGVNHPDGSPETDTDHSVSLAWVACSLARYFYPERLDVGLVAQFAIVHDAVEAYAGDMYAVNASDEDRKIQKEREEKALEQFRGELREIEWLPVMVTRYEEQECPEARFVWAIDKMMPKIVLRIEGRAKETLQAHGVDRENVRAYRKYEREIFEEHIPDFPEILRLREELHALLTLGDEEIV